MKMKFYDKPFNPERPIVKQDIGWAIDLYDHIIDTKKQANELAFWGLKSSNTGRYLRGLEKAWSMVPENIRLQVEQQMYGC